MQKNLDMRAKPNIEILCQYIHLQNVGAELLLLVEVFANNTTLTMLTYLTHRSNSGARQMLMTS